MTRKRERFFALMGALLFLVTSAALTIAVVFQAASNKSDSSNSAADANTNASQTTACDIQTPVSAQTMKAPDVYKPSGKVSKLQVTDLQSGSGQAAKKGDCLVMKYQGSLASSGKVFDENYTKPQALQFVLGSSDPQQQVIPGWEQGLAGMKVGGTRRLVIPAALGYGPTGSPPAIPGNADLVFVVKLLSIK